MRQSRRRDVARNMIKADSLEECRFIDWRRRRRRKKLLLTAKTKLRVLPALGSDVPPGRKWTSRIFRAGVLWRGLHFLTKRTLDLLLPRTRWRRSAFTRAAARRTRMATRSASTTPARPSSTRGRKVGGHSCVSAVSTCAETDAGWKCCKPRVLVSIFQLLQ
jgi:hypothetical protein